MTQDQSATPNSTMDSHQIYTKRQKSINHQYQMKQRMRRQERQREYQRRMALQSCTCNTNQLQQELESLRKATKDALHQAWDNVESLNEKYAIQEKQLRYFMEQIEESQTREKRLIAKNQKIQELIQLRNKSQMQRKRNMDSCKALNLPQFQGQRQKSHEETNSSRGAATMTRRSPPLLPNQSILIPTINENGINNTGKTEPEINTMLGTTRRNTDEDASGNTSLSIFKLGFSKYSQILNDPQSSTQRLLKKIGSLSTGTTPGSCDGNDSSCHPHQGRCFASKATSTSSPTRSNEDNYSFRPASAPPPLPPSSSSSVTSITCHSIEKDSLCLSSSSSPPYVAEDVCKNDCHHTTHNADSAVSNEEIEDVHVDKHIIMNNTNKTENDDQTTVTGTSPSSSASCGTIPLDQEETSKSQADHDCSRSDHYIQELKAKIESREKEIKSLEW
eukprot:CAMPEP_0203682844 /NCGR_PEP_ID=MMETSP0090-20130426/47209_1 /ASSEMBLY_ACC=CAM_ASM_001088 /TAXON_ID=426623 /ORGANISM="Chaetoceros affinis, Strain CCMP159" /LENGTH=446 /DNA_ID=CAMNT_0050551961 /DNA_START=97 /DNA_END=1434 /DNA_ORIENTATION=+